MILQPQYEGFNNAVNIEFNDISMKTKLIGRPGIIAIRFDEKSLFSTNFGFNPHWDYKHDNEYSSQKFINSDTIDRIHLKCDRIDGSVAKGK